MGTVPAEVKGSLIDATIGGTTYRLGGIGGITENTSEATTTTEEFIDGTTITTVGARPASTYTIDVANYLPHLPEWALMKSSLVSGDRIAWTFTRPQKVISPEIPNTLAAITAATGAVAFSGSGTNPTFSDDQFGRGQAIKIANVDYLITEIDASGQVTVVPPASDVAAAAYQVVIPESTVTGTAPLSDFASFGSSTPGGLVSSTFTIAPSTDFSLPTLTNAP